MLLYDYDDLLNNDLIRIYDKPEEEGEIGEFESYEVVPIDSIKNSVFNPVGMDLLRQKNQPPKSPPPSYLPSKKDTNVEQLEIGTTAVAPGSIRMCLYRYVYIWQRNGRSYWAYLTFVNRRSIAGWRWAGYRWVYFGVDLRSIDSFVCY